MHRNVECGCKDIQGRAFINVTASPYCGDIMEEGLCLSHGYEVTLDGASPPEAGQEQIVSLYNSSKSNISEHIKHILEEGELDGNSVVRNFRTTASDGKRHIFKNDICIRCGYSYPNPTEWQEDI